MKRISWPWVVQICISQAVAGRRNHTEGPFWKNLFVHLPLWSPPSGLPHLVEEPGRSTEAESPQNAAQGVHETGSVRDFTALLFLSCELLTFSEFFPFNSFAICSIVQCFPLFGHSRAQRALPEQPRHNGKGFPLGPRHTHEKELYLGQVFYRKC